MTTLRTPVTNYLATPCWWHELLHASSCCRTSPQGAHMAGNSWCISWDKFGNGRERISVKFLAPFQNAASCYNSQTRWTVYERRQSCQPSSHRQLFCFECRPDCHHACRHTWWFLGDIMCGCPAGTVTVGSTSVLATLWWSRLQGSGIIGNSSLLSANVENRCIHQPIQGKEQVQKW